jgi:pimeloyl-ACP methyl ester carboxylesterase
MAERAKPVFVLVHGAWHGGWCWSRVTPLLEAAGHRTIAVTLTGQGDRAHLIAPDIGLGTHTDDVVGTIEKEDLADIVLVGHSYGGMVISGAADRVAPRIRRLVFLDGLVPAPGQCAFDLNSAQFRERMERETRESGEGYKVAPRADIFGITDDADRQWVEARLRPIPIGCFREPLAAPTRAAAALPSTFILCTRFAFHDTASRCRAAGWPVIEIDCGHDAMIVAPKALAEALLSPSCQ